MLFDTGNVQKLYKLIHPKVGLNTENYEGQKLLFHLMNMLIEPVSLQYLFGQHQILN